MVKPIMILKTSFMAVSLPIIMKSFLYNFLFYLVLLSIYIAIKSTYYYKSWFILFLFFPIITFLFGLMKLDFVFFPVFFTKYIFYENYIEKKYNFFTERTKTIPYAHIVNVTIDKTLYDKILNTGTLYIYTGNDGVVLGAKSISLKLVGIKNPENIRDFILKKL